MPNHTPHNSFQSDLQIELTEKANEAEIAELGGRSLANFAHFLRFSRAKSTELYFVRVRNEDQVVALVPTVRLSKRKATDMLRPELRRWLGPTLGVVARKTTWLLDTAFLAYDYASPFYCRPAMDRQRIKLAVADFLKKQKSVDTLWIAEPPAETSWAREAGFDHFYTLPMVHVSLDGITSLDDYLASLSKKRRRNFRCERETFAKGGATIEQKEGPLEDPLLEQLHKLLQQSELNSRLIVPYNDVLIDRDAFAQQAQTLLIAKLHDRPVGFISFIEAEDRLLQCHGGLDYEHSHEVQAYHNLIYAAIEYAIARGLSHFSMGPLNNETKRRAGTQLLPMVANLWNRNPVDALFARKFFIKNFDVYQGEFEGALQSEAASLAS